LVGGVCCWCSGALFAVTSVWLAMGCCCHGRGVLVARVLLLAEATAWLATGCCCCHGRGVLFVLVLLLAKASAWLAMGCYCKGAVVLVALVLLSSRRRHRLG
jgi:hypothetical protein